MTVVWITGAHGFIGRHLARHLARSDTHVYGIGHGVWPEVDARKWGVSGWINGEINASNLDSLRAMSGDPACLYHLAGGSTVGGSMANPLEDFSRTVITTAHLLDWLRMHAPECDTVAVSSAAVYGSQYPGPIPESSATSPYSPYGHHKLMMEQLCRSYAENFALRVCIVRLFSVYGPWLRKQLLWDLCSRIASGTDSIRLGGTGDERRDWTDVRDVSRLLELAASQCDTHTPVINGGTGTATCVRDIASLVIQAWGLDAVAEFSGQGRPGDPFSLVADPGQLADMDFRWEISVTDGICHYVAWFRKYWS